MVQISEQKMTPEQFAYWLQGYMEVCGKYPDDKQWQIIRDHLSEVFTKVTPSYDLPWIQ